ncbi:hypothetical protein BH18ACT12_BH18ACT12_20580 [soil metagenome]
MLDFIGSQHGHFRFDLRYRALTGMSRRGLGTEIERGFPFLPAGSHIELDRVASEIVLQNVRSALRMDWRGLARELQQLGDRPLRDFLRETYVDLDDIYRRHRGGWAGLRRLAGFDDRTPTPDDTLLARAFARMLHVDDPERLGFIMDLLKRSTPPSGARLPVRQQRLFRMLHFLLWGASEPAARASAGFSRLWAVPSRHEELMELMVVLRGRLRRVSRPLDEVGRVPLHVHARYSRDEALAAFGIQNPGAVREGVKWIEPEQADVFFVTLRKTERHYSPTTMYQDRAITPLLFQWESQSTTSEASPTGQRYVGHRERGSSVHLFIRETKEADGDMGAPAYLYAGPASYVSHTGDRPLRIVWRLRYELPAETFHSARVAAG